MMPCVKAVYYEHNCYVMKCQAASHAQRSAKEHFRREVSFLVTQFGCRLADSFPFLPLRRTLSPVLRQASFYGWVG